MNILLIIAFVGVEIGFIAISRSEDTTGKDWYRNRLFVNVLELVLFLVFAIFPGVDFSFRFKGLVFMLIIRLIWAGIFFLAKRRAVGNVKMGRMVSSGICAVILLVSSLIPSFIFADYEGMTPSGSYSVGTAEIILVDESRLETFENDGSYREVPVKFFYPENAKGQKFPLVVFSHGAFGYNASNYSTYEELASNGYVVAALSHPYHSFFCKDTSGKLITVNMEFMNEVMYINQDTTSEAERFALSSKWMTVRTPDISFVLDSFEDYADSKELDSRWFISETSNVTEILEMMDLEHIGVMGHSMGGAASVNIGRIRSDVDAVIDLDGTMIGEQLELIPSEELVFEGITYHEKYVLNQEPYPTSILAIDNEEHHYSRIEAERIGMPYANNGVMENAVDGYDTWFKGSGHMNFTDLPLFSPVLSKSLGTGPIDSRECISEMNTIILNFFNDKLKNEGTFRVEECYGN